MPQSTPTYNVHNQYVMGTGAMRTVAGKRRLYLWGLLLLLVLFPARTQAQVKIFSVPREVQSDRFHVTLNGRPAAVMHAASGYDALSFDLAGRVTIRATASEAGFWKHGVEVEPWRLNIRPKIQGRTITFTLHAPAKLSITRPGDHFADATMLFMFANAPEAHVPRPDTPGVRYYGPGVYRTSLNPHSGDTIYLAPGAVVFGALNLWGVSNVRVMGRGTIVYDGPQNPKADEGWMHKPDWHCIVMDKADNIEIDGITCVVRSRTWQIQMKDSHHIGFNNVKVIGGNPNDANQDGMDWLGGGDTAVRDSFFRASDDVFALQGNWDGYSQAAMLAPGHDVRNITVEHTVVSTSISNIVRMGWPQKIFNSSNFILRDVDVLHMGYGSCGIPFALFGVWANRGAKGEHDNYRFDDVRLEHWYSLLQIDKPLPGVHGVELDGVWALGGTSLVPSVVEGAITGTVLRNVSVGGRVARSDSDIPMRVAAGAAPAEFAGSGLQPGIEYSAGVLRAHQPVTFSVVPAADGGPGVRYEWLFGDGTSTSGASVRHAFPDASGTLQDGSGRFRVLLNTTDAAGHTAWTARSVVIGNRVAAARTVEPGLLRPGLKVWSEAGERGAGREDRSNTQAAGDTPFAAVMAQSPVGATVHFDGYIDIPADGGYDFSVLSPGKTALAIDERPVAASPRARLLVCGTPGFAVQAATGSAVLRKGLHRFALTAERAAGSGTLAVQWEGPGFLPSSVPLSAFQHER